MNDGIETNSKKDLPFFSVIITSYNRAELLRRALNTLILQTESDWEAIIIDDGSTDRTPLQITSYLKNKKIRFYRQENKGCVVSKNTGIALSRGKYITFLDSDDEYNPDHLATRKKMLTENPTIDFLHGGVKVIGNPYVPDRFETDKRVHLNHCVIGGTFFINHKLLADLKGFKNITLGHDAELFDRVIKSGAKIMKTDLPTYIYHRETEDSITNNQPINIFR